MSHTHHFPEHIDRLRRLYSLALDETGKQFAAVMIHSGGETFYYGDDQSAPFRSYGHFAHWLPVNLANQVLLIIPGNIPIYFQVCPKDYWHEVDSALPSWVEAQFEIYTLNSSAQVADQLSAILGKAAISSFDIAYLGENTQYAKAVGLRPHSLNPPALLKWLDFQRAYKSEYEIACIRTANRIALQGHQAARHAFVEGGSEYAIHMAYLLACNSIETETPYTNIVALNEKAATLHYQNKRRKAPDTSQVLLIDAGHRFNGYCSDITRTHASESAHPVFHELLERMQDLQTELVQMVMPGREYLHIHEHAHKGIAEILSELDICNSSIDEIFSKDIPSLFMPHGVGHLLGLQVHDVGGRQINTLGEIKPPPERFPTLRTTRMIEQDQVFTIEPGFYFIEQLLLPEQCTDRGKSLNWSLIESLIPCGGIRIEDNVLATATGADNLTRLLL